MSVRVYYFGCWGGPGHFVWTPAGRMAERENTATPWSLIELGGQLCPGDHGDGRPVPMERQIEGAAVLHHRSGWTALAFWDRSADKRGGCNSVFLAEGTHDFEGMTALAAEHFPAVWGRICGAFEVRAPHLATAHAALAAFAPHGAVLPEGATFALITPTPQDPDPS